MDKNTLKSIIELQADRINQLEAVVKVRRKEMNVLESRLKAYQAESKSHKENAEKWNEEADRVNEILDKKDQECQHLKRNYNAFKEKNDNLLIANSRLIEETKSLRKENDDYKKMVDEQNLQIALMNEDDGARIKEIETKCAKNIARAERHYENLMAVMSLKETLRLFTQIETAIELNPFNPPDAGMGYYAKELYMDDYQKESMQIILNDIDTEDKKDIDIVKEAKEHIVKRIKYFENNACSPSEEWLKLFNFKVGGEDKSC